MSELAERFADAVLRARAPVVAVSLALSLLAAIFASRLGFDSDIETWFLENDPSLVAYHEFLERFESDEICIIALISDDAFTPERLSAIDRMTEEAAQAPHALRASSLTNVEVIESRGPAHAAVGPLIRELPQTSEQAAQLRQRALGNPLVRDFVVSRDGAAAAVVVEMDPAAQDFEKKVELVEALRAIGERHLPPDTAMHLAGAAVLDEAFFIYTGRDMALLGPSGAALIVLLCFVLFRRPALAMMPVIVVLVSILWLFGLMGLLGRDINIVSTGLLTVVLAVGVADSVHVLSAVQQELAAGRDPGEALRRSLAELLVPCLFTSFTTVAGFLSLSVSELRPIADFGVLCALGVFLALVTSMTLAPALLSYLPASAFQRSDRKPPQQERFVAAALDWLGRPTRRRSVLVLVAAAMLFVAGVSCLPMLDVGANPMTYFRRGDPVRRSTEVVDRAFGGTGTYELMVDTEPGGLKEPEVLSRLQGLAEHLESLPGITRVYSVLDGLREVRRVLTDGRPGSARLPDTRPMAAQFYLTIEGDDDFRRNLLGDYESTRMTARVRLSEAGDLAERLPALDDWLAREFDDPSLRVVPTGYLKLVSDMERYLIDSQIQSLGLAFVVVTVMMLALLRSMLLMVLSMIPNMVPIAMGLSVMAIADLALDPGTVMIGSVALGLVVDDTVHFLARLRRFLDGHSVQEAIALSMQQTGRAIVFTSVILASGFCVLGLATLAPNAVFGLVSGCVILLALLCDLVVLPAVLTLAPRAFSR